MKKSIHFDFTVEKSFAGRQSQGARPYQEDSYGFSLVELPGKKKEIGLLVILADGMGGLEDGKRASSLAVGVFNDSFIDNYLESEDIRFGLSCGLTAANSAVEVVNRNRFGADGDMGTTLVGAFISGDQLNWISVGDSPLFIIRQGEIKRLNEDHSMKAIYKARVMLGNLSEEEARTAPEKSALLSAITGEEIKHVDQPLKGFTLKRSDTIVLASDGIDTISFSEICRICGESKSGGGSGNKANYLLGAVLNVGKKRQDNVTVAVVDLK